VVGFNAALRSRPLWEQALEHTPRHPDHAAVFADLDPKLHRLPLGIPVSVLGKGEQNIPPLSFALLRDVPYMFMNTNAMGVGRSRVCAILGNQRTAWRLANGSVVETYNVARSHLVGKRHIEQADGEHLHELRIDLTVTKAIDEHEAGVFKVVEEPIKLEADDIDAVAAALVRRLRDVVQNHGDEQPNPMLLRRLHDSPFQRDELAV
jgi:hypothetical protein